VSESVFAQLRRACAEVVARARSVRVESGALGALAESLAREAPRPAHPDPARHPKGNRPVRLAYILVLDAINFGSGYFPTLRKRPGMSGYFTVAACLRERFEAHGPWRADELSALSARDCADWLGQDVAVPAVAELMGLYARALNDLGGFLIERYAGRFDGPVLEARHSAARLVEILAHMPFYRDVAEYEGIRVPFYKRAQLTAADLAVAFEGRGYGEFLDLDQLTCFADNLVPHVLRRAGVLVYASDLAKRIDAGELIRVGSPEEVEIRAAAVHVVERCADTLRAAGVSTTAHRLDYVLWSRGQAREVKAHPRHRARSVYY
jgi:hypothetical protein